MNPGPVEEAGGTARAAIDAMSSTPALLLILCFNIIFMALVAWATHENGQRWERLLTSCQQQAK